jgi:hypothetical protein
MKLVYTFDGRTVVSEIDTASIKNTDKRNLEMRFCIRGSQAIYTAKFEDLEPDNCGSIESAFDALINEGTADIRKSATVAVGSEDPYSWSEEFNNMYDDLDEEYYACAGEPAEIPLSQEYGEPYSDYDIVGLDDPLNF